MAIERFPIEAGHVMMFARAIGDPNPIYADADVAAASEVGAIPAPPTFVTASAQFDPDYPLRPKIGERWFGSGREATGVKSSGDGGSRGGGGGGGGTSLHAEQHYEYHRPLVVGDVLHARGRKGDTWEKQGRSGTLKFTELITEYLDEHDEVVITARTVAVLTEGPK
jgi:acyl dehydratase